MDQYHLPAPLSEVVTRFKDTDVRDQASLVPELSLLTGLLQIELLDLESVAGRRRAAELAGGIAKLKLAWAQQLEASGQLFSVQQVIGIVQTLVEMVNDALGTHAPDQRAAVVDAIVGNAKFKTLSSEPRLLLDHKPLEATK